MSESIKVGTENFWVQTRSGRAVDLIDTTPEQICAADLAIQLARQPRWNGATAGQPGCIYPLASHSVLVSRLITRESAAALKLAALLHDGAEAYTGDMPSPLKWAMRFLYPGVDPYRTISEHIQAAIHEAVGLTFQPVWHAAIKHADMLALALEDKYLMAPHPRAWIEMPDVSRAALTPMTIGPAAAAAEFMMYLRLYVKAAGCKPVQGFWP